MDMTPTVEELEAENERLRDALEKLVAYEVIEAIAALEAKNKRIEELEAEIERLRDEHGDMNVACVKYEKRIEELEAQAIAEGRIVGKCNKIIEELEAENEKLRGERDYYKEIALRYNRDLAALEEGVENAPSEEEIQ